MIAAAPSWKNKPMSDWTDEDTRQILNDSPWTKSVEAIIGPLQTEDERREGGNMGLPTGIGYDGFPDDRPRPELPRNPVEIMKPENNVRRRSYLTLQVRWETALPVRVAELKSHAAELPTAANNDYIVAVYGLPSANVKGSPEALGKPLKSQAMIRREGRKDVRPSRVEVYQDQNGLTVVYVFPASAEITLRDQRLEFDARIGRVGVIRSFDLGEMQFQGKLEL